LLLNDCGIERNKIVLRGVVIMQDVMDRLRAISERLKKEYKAEKVILFGSYARGEATEDSDCACSFADCFETRRSS